MRREKVVLFVLHFLDQLTLKFFEGNGDSGCLGLELFCQLLHPSFLLFAAFSKLRQSLNQGRSLVGFYLSLWVICSEHFDYRLKLIWQPGPKVLLHQGNPVVSYPFDEIFLYLSELLH
jgi:hypothetical protein